MQELFFLQHIVLKVPITLLGSEASMLVPPHLYIYIYLYIYIMRASDPNKVIGTFKTIY